MTCIIICVVNSLDRRISSNCHFGDIELKFGICCQSPYPNKSPNFKTVVKKKSFIKSSYKFVDLGPIGHV